MVLLDSKYTLSFNWSRSAQDHMSELPSVRKEIVKVRNRPTSFIQIVESTAKKLSLKMSSVRFNVEVSRSEDQDGTERIIRHPILLSDIDNLNSHGSFVLQGSEQVYFLIQKGWEDTRHLPGFEYNEGDQTFCSEILIIRLQKGTPLQTLRTPDPPYDVSIFYSYKQHTGLGPAHVPCVRGEEAEADLSAVGDDPFLREIANGLEKPSTI